MEKIMYKLPNQTIDPSPQCRKTLITQLIASATSRTGEVVAPRQTGTWGTTLLSVLTLIDNFNYRFCAHNWQLAE